MRRVMLVAVVLGMTAGATPQSTADIIQNHAHTFASAPNAEDGQNGQNPAHFASSASASGTATSGSSLLIGNAMAFSIGVPGESFLLRAKRDRSAMAI